MRDVQQVLFSINPPMKNNKLIPIITIFLLLITSVLAVKLIDTRYYDLSLPLNQQDGVWFEEPYNQNPNTFWFDSQGDYSSFLTNSSTYKFTPYSDGEYGTDISGVDWYTNIRDNYTDVSYSYMNNIEIAYSFDGTTDTALIDPEIIVLRPSSIDVLKYLDTFNTLTLDSSASSTFKGFSDPDTTESEWALYYKINHLGMIDFNDDGAVDLVTIEEVGNDAFLQGYYYDEGILADASYSLNITHMNISENTTGNIDCYANANINGSVIDMCVIVNNYCELFVVEATSTNFTELFEIDFSDSCQATGGSNTSGMSGVLSNKIVDDFFLSDGKDQEWIHFIYSRSNSTDRDSVEIMRELLPGGEQLDNFITDHGSGDNAWEVGGDFNIKADFMSSSLGEQFIIKEWGYGSPSGNNIIITKYYYSGGLYVATDIYTYSSYAYGKPGLFIPNSAVLGGKSYCYPHQSGYACIDNAGAVTTSTNTDWYDLETSGDPSIHVEQIFDTQGVDDFKTLIIRDTLIGQVDYGINGGIGISESFDLLSNDNGVHISNSGSMIMGYIDDDQYPDLLEFDREDLEIRLTVSGFTNFPPSITDVDPSWNTSEVCFYPTNYSDQTGQFCWSLTCSDSENDYVGLWVDWDEGNGFERYTEAGSFRCSLGLTGGDAVCHSYNDTGTFTPTFMINQTALYPQNNDNVTVSDSLTIGTEGYCVGSTGLTPSVTLPGSVTFESGSFASDSIDFWENLGFTDSVSKMVLGLIIMIITVTSILIALASRGVSGNVLGLVSMITLGVEYVVLTFLGLFPIGLFIILMILGIAFGVFRFMVLKDDDGG